MKKEWEGTKILFETELKTSDISHEIRVDNQTVAMFNKVDDANLFKDALETIQLENTLPSKLKEQRNELMRLSELLLNSGIDQRVRYDLAKLLNKINNGE